jgi:hypothetical protein
VSVCSERVVLLWKKAQSDGSSAWSGPVFLRGKTYGAGLTLGEAVRHADEQRSGGCDAGAGPDWQQRPAQGGRRSRASSRLPPTAAGAAARPALRCQRALADCQGPSDFSSIFSRQRSSPHSHLTGPVFPPPPRACPPRLPQHAHLPGADERQGAELGAATPPQHRPQLHLCRGHERLPRPCPAHLIGGRSHTGRRHGRRPRITHTAAASPCCPLHGPWAVPASQLPCQAAPPPFPTPTHPPPPRNKEQTHPPSHVIHTAQRTLSCPPTGANGQERGHAGALLPAGGLHPGCVGKRWARVHGAPRAGWWGEGAGGFMCRCAGVSMRETAGGRLCRAAAVGQTLAGQRCSAGRQARPCLPPAYALDHSSILARLRLRACASPLPPPPL